MFFLQRKKVIKKRPPAEKGAFFFSGLRWLSFVFPPSIVVVLAPATPGGWGYGEGLPDVGNS